MVDLFTNKLNLLIVCDEMVNLINYKKLFADNYRTLRASSTDEAETILLKEDIHILIFDLNINIDEAILFILLHHFSHPSCVNILLSNHPNFSFYESQLKNANIFALKQKPFAKNEFSELIKLAEIHWRIQQLPTIKQEREFNFYQKKQTWHRQHFSQLSDEIKTMLLASSTNLKLAIILAAVTTMFGTIVFYL
ncbi:MAG: hypothetical protein HRT88_18000 [Lentisphaeraceae bacterium]|nr:hypothetical protein [Lentisphaeraceae bacterium]